MSHVLRVGVADQIAYFRAYNTDGSANTGLTASTTGLTLSVFRVGASSVSIASLSNKAADDTAHSDGSIRNVGGNLYTIDLPDAACATQVPSICVRGSYTGGVLEGLEHPIVAYDPSVVAVGANTTTPPTAATVADAVWDEATVDHTSTGSFGKLLGSGSSVIVGPLVQTNSQRAQPSYIETYQYDKSTLGPFRLEDAAGDQYDLAGVTDWILIVWDKDNNELGVVPYADLDITSSTSNAVMDQYSFAPIAGQVATDGRHRFALRRPRGTSEQTAASGTFNVIATPRGPEA